MTMLCYGATATPITISTPLVFSAVSLQAFKLTATNTDTFILTTDTATASGIIRVWYEIGSTLYETAAVSFTPGRKQFQLDLTAGVYYLCMNQTVLGTGSIVINPYGFASSAYFTFSVYDGVLATSQLLRVGWCSEGAAFTSSLPKFNGYDGTNVWIEKVKPTEGGTQADDFMLVFDYKAPRIDCISKSEFPQWTNIDEHHNFRPYVDKSEAKIVRVSTGDIVDTRPVRITIEYDFALDEEYIIADADVVTDVIEESIVSDNIFNDGDIIVEDSNETPEFILFDHAVSGHADMVLPFYENQLCFIGSYRLVWGVIFDLDYNYWSIEYDETEVAETTAELTEITTTDLVSKFIALTGMTGASEIKIYTSDGTRADWAHVTKIYGDEKIEALKT